MLTTYEEEFARIYEILNQNFFDGMLPLAKFEIIIEKKVEIVFKKKSNVYQVGRNFYEVDRFEIADKLLHEMIHHYNHSKNIVDVNANQYHTQDFSNKAIDVGFFVIKHKSQGWSLLANYYPRNCVESTCVKIPAMQNMEKKYNCLRDVEFSSSVYEKLRNEIKNVLKNVVPKNYLLKYVCNCPPPYNSIRCGRKPKGKNGPNVICAYCKSFFVCESQRA